MKLDFYPVTQDRGQDFEAFMESKGSPHYCWCCLWRQIDQKSGKAEKKDFMKQQVVNGIPIGILAYKDNEPIAWCSVAPRTTYKSLGGCGFR